MPPKTRRAYNRARPRRMKAGLKKRMRYGRYSKYRLTRPFFYKQTVNGSSLTGITARFINQQISAQNIALEFRAVDLPQWGTMNALYDQYCITKIVLKFVPMTTSNDFNGTVAGINIANPGIFATVIDRDDSNPLGSLTDYQQYESFKMVPCISTRTHTRIVTPSVRTYNITTGGGSQPSGIKTKQWIDCAQGSVSHYGLKIYVDPYGSANAVQCWQVFATYYVKFRNVR